MIVYGFRVTPEQAEAVEAVGRLHRFETKQVVKAATEAGVPKKGKGEFWNRDPSKALSSHLIQRLRRSGEIVQVRPGLWKRILTP